MPRRPPIDFDLSVSKAKKKGVRRRGFSGEFAHRERTCEWDGCDKDGGYRAPKSPDQLNEFRWFCLDHVREYNSRWNFYANMSEDEIADSLRSDQLWGRPTWKLGKTPPHVAGLGPHGDGEAWRRFGFDDPMEVLGERATLNPGARADARAARERSLPPLVRRALGIFDLDALATREDLRKRYKDLVKRYHPDQNGGDRSEEARLREVIWAWDQLKASTLYKE